MPFHFSHRQGYGITLYCPLPLQMPGSASLGGVEDCVGGAKLEGTVLIEWEILAFLENVL